MTSDKTLSEPMPDRSRLSNNTSTKSKTTEGEIQNDSTTNYAAAGADADTATTSTTEDYTAIYTNQRCEGNAYQHNGNHYMSGEPDEANKPRGKAYYSGQVATGNATQVNGNVYGKAKTTDSSGEEAERRAENREDSQ